MGLFKKLFKKKQFKLTKRPATEAESKAAIKFCIDTSMDVEARRNEAIAEGYKDEVCDCGRLFLAHHHFVRCDVSGCPMRSADGKSLAQMMLDRMEEKE
jgi:hypothetical protein